MALLHVPPWLWRKPPELPIHPLPPTAATTTTTTDLFSLPQSPASSCEDLRLRPSENMPHRWSDDVPRLNQKSSMRSSKSSMPPQSVYKGEARVMGQQRGSGSSRKWLERQVDAEFDLVVVPPDGCCMSGSDSEDSDWSVGWLEPLSTDFSDSEDHFAVIVPCYGSSSPKLVATSRKSLSNSEDAQAFGTSVLPHMSRLTSTEHKAQVKQWLASLQE